MADNRAILEKAYRDFANGDVAAVVAVLDDDIQWFEAEGNPFWQGAPVVGPQQVVEQIFARVVQEYDDFTITAGRILECGDTLLVQGRYTGPASGRGAG